MGVSDWSKPTYRTTVTPLIDDRSRLEPGCKADTRVRRSSHGGWDPTYICGYYLLKAQATQDPRHLENYVKMRTVGLTRRVQQESWEPFSPETLRRIIRTARSYKGGRKASRIVEPEDYPFLMTLLYTGGRAQFYGLRVDEIAFDRNEITTTVKGGG